METRFPVGNDSEHVKLSFTWYDSFRPSKKTEQASIYFEKASVLFNMGAVLTQTALAADRTSDVGLKDAARRFQVGVRRVICCHVPLISAPSLHCVLPRSSSGVSGFILCCEVTPKPCLACITCCSITRGFGRPWLTQFFAERPDRLPAASAVCCPVPTLARLGLSKPV